MWPLARGDIRVAEVPRDWRASTHVQVMGGLRHRTRSQREWRRPTRCPPLIDLGSTLNSRLALSALYFHGSRCPRPNVPGPPSFQEPLIEGVRIWQTLPTGEDPRDGHTEQVLATLPTAILVVTTRCYLFELKRVQLAGRTLPKSLV